MNLSNGNVIARSALMVRHRWIALAAAILALAATLAVTNVFVAPASAHHTTHCRPYDLTHQDQYGLWILWYRPKRSWTTRSGRHHYVYRSYFCPPTVLCPRDSPWRTWVVRECRPAHD